MTEDCPIKKDAEREINEFLLKNINPYRLDISKLSKAVDGELAKLTIANKLYIDKVDAKHPATISKATPIYLRNNDAVEVNQQTAVMLNAYERLEELNEAIKHNIQVYAKTRVRNMQLQNEIEESNRKLATYEHIAEKNPENISNYSNVLNTRTVLQNQQRDLVKNTTDLANIINTLTIQTERNNSLKELIEESEQVQKLTRVASSMYKDFKQTMKQYSSK